MKKIIIEVCHGSSCSKNFSADVYKEAKSFVEKNRIEEIKVETCNCTNNCEIGPNVRIKDEDGSEKIFHNMSPRKIKLWIEEKRKTGSSLNS